MANYILVVDDEEDIREALSELLGDTYTVVTASNGREALNLLRSRERPFFVLLDLMMPVMDGWQLLKEMAEDVELSSIPLSITTSVPERAPAGRHVIPKPIDLDVLFDRVRWTENQLH